MRFACAISSVKRLAKTSEYRRIYKKGRCRKGDFLWAYLLPAPARNIRVGVSINAHVVKKATDRNRLKRIIREWLRKNLPRILGHGCGLVIVVKKAAPGARGASKTIRKELSTLIGNEPFNNNID